MGSPPGSGWIWFGFEKRSNCVQPLKEAKHCVEYAMTVYQRADRGAPCSNAFWFV